MNLKCCGLYGDDFEHVSLKTYNVVVQLKEACQITKIKAHDITEAKRIAPRIAGQRFDDFESVLDVRAQA